MRLEEIERMKGRRERMERREGQCKTERWWIKKKAGNTEGKRDKRQEGKTR